MSEGRVVRPRRRGETLRGAILDAAWVELREHAWSGFSIERVAERARTGKAAIYKRWPNKATLVREAAARKAVRSGSEWVSTGSLREDLIAHLDSSARFVAGPFGESIRGLVSEPILQRGEELGDHGLNGPTVGIVDAIVTRAREEGSLGPRQPEPSVLHLGNALVDYHYLLSGRAPALDLVTEIVDAIWLPALRAACHS